MAVPGIAEVIVETGGYNLQKSLYYEIPGELHDKVCVGSRVQVPLGKRRVSGFVVGFASQPDAMDNLKPILKLLDETPVFTEEQLKIARWVSGYYFCSPQKTLQTIASPVLHKTSSPSVKYFYINFSKDKLNQLTDQLKRSPKQAKALKVIAENPGMTKKQAAEKAGVSYSVIDSLGKKGYIYFYEEIKDRDPYTGTLQAGNKPELTKEQVASLKSINKGLQAGNYKVFLLHGVTGSGKTEVYLRSIDRALELNRSAIVLVPEISLTPQMIKQFKERFGKRVALLHSHMSWGERYDQWRKILNGYADVVLGVRSAIFAPVKNPGLIIIDEEHEFSYKQEEAPRYHARAVALYRAFLNNAVVILGSATPSLESYCRTGEKGPYELLKMKKRVDNIAMPRINVVDMRSENSYDKKAILSMKLFNAINTRLENNEQVILFLNRRGFNTIVVCRDCGLVLKCPNCDISLTYHSQGDLRCHYCNYSQIAPSLCPECYSRKINYLGMGTQKVEKEVKGLFPGAGVMRMDADTTGRKGAHQQILESFEAGSADILIGTQMIAKGLNIPGVTLVGVISADHSLYMPDFRSGERTFQLLTQVSGRPGRASSTGEVIIQTYNPEHYAVSKAAEGNYYSFFEQEMKLRKDLQYPPFTRMVRLLVSGRKEEKVNEMAETIYKEISSYTEREPGVQSAGPAPAPLSRIRGNYRLHIVLWSKHEDILREAVKKAAEKAKEKGEGTIARLNIDVDPYNMM